MMGSHGHGKAFGQLLKVRVRGLLAWFVRRTYYLLQMPGWGRRSRIMIDWTFALLFRPDSVKIRLDSEAATFLRKRANKQGGSFCSPRCACAGFGEFGSAGKRLQMERDMLKSNPMTRLLGFSTRFGMLIVVPTMGALIVTVTVGMQPQAGDGAAKFKQVLGDFNKAKSEYDTAEKAAKSDADRNTAKAKHPNMELFSQRMLDVANGHPKDAAA